MMDEATMWLARERLADARQRAAEHRRAGNGRGGVPRQSLVRRMRRAL
jgi:hypothetical protein